MPTEKAQAAAIVRDLERLAEGAVRDIGSAVMSELVANTRVDTGLTQANWLASRRAPRAEPVGNRSPAGVAAARAAQDASRGELDAFKLGDGRLYISNAEGNAERLNDGLDAGYVQRGIVRGVAVGSALASARLSGAGAR